MLIEMIKCHCNVLIMYQLSKIQTTLMLRGRYPHKAKQRCRDYDGKLCINIFLKQFVFVK